MTDETVRGQQREAYSYLMSYKEYDLRIRRLTLQHDELQASLLPQGIRYDKIQVQTSPENTLEKVAGKVLDIEQRITQLEEERAACLADIVDTIESLEDDSISSSCRSFSLPGVPWMRLPGRCTIPRAGHTKSGIMHFWPSIIKERNPEHHVL